MHTCAVDLILQCGTRDRDQAGGIMPARLELNPGAWIQPTPPLPYISRPLTLMVLHHPRILGSWRALDHTFLEPQFLKLTL